MVEKGLAKAGYSYVVMDEGWQALERDAEGRQQHNATRFPSGISALAEYVHALGLKIGLYRYSPFVNTASHSGSLFCFFSLREGRSEEQKVTREKNG